MAPRILGDIRLQCTMRILTVTALFLTLLACQSREFEPPTTPAHTIEEDGFLHARGFERPFLCRDPVTGDRGPCPIGRPARGNLSCDAAGCHGDNNYDEPPDVERSLHGSDGPSCWTCHDQEWSGRVE